MTVSCRETKIKKYIELDKKLVSIPKLLAYLVSFFSLLKKPRIFRDVRQDSSLYQRDYKPVDFQDYGYLLYTAA